MGDLLFLAHRIPFPPDRGDKIRSHHLLKALTELAPVHVGCFGDTVADFAHEQELAQVAASHCLVRRSKRMPRAGLEALASGRPVSLTAFDHSELRAWVNGTLAAKDIDTIFVFSGQMGQFVPASFAGRVVIDLCDVDSAKFEAYAASGVMPRKWIDAREGRLLAEEEARLARRADTVLLVTEAEAALLRSRLPVPADVRALRNGIDTAFFDPQAVAAHPDLDRLSGPHFVFTGQMDYAPNVAAAQRAAKAILPAIGKVHPGAQLHIVGRAPAPRVRALAGPKVRVWGEVPDVRPFLAAADIVLAPLAIARGVQNKVLEAMAMARPVLLTPEAATGIDAQDEVHFAVEAEDHAITTRALALLADVRRARDMANMARRFVVERQGWAAMLAPLAEIAGRSPEAGRDAA